MNESRAFSLWLGAGLLVVIGVFVFLIGQMGSWWRWDAGGAGLIGGGPGSPASLADVFGEGEDEPEPDLEPAPPVDPREMWADRLLAALHDRVQSVGAIANEAVLTFKDHDAMEAFLRRADAKGLKVLGRIDSLNSVRVGYEKLAGLRNDLLENPDAYSDIGANYLVKVPGLPAPEDRAEGGDAPFGDSVMGAIGANVDRATWGKGVTVAVLDTGVSAHPTFRNGQVTHIDLVQDGLPFDGHGTAMASLIGGTKYGADGLAPAASILDVRIAGAEGESDSFLLARGILTAVDRGAQIINISMASYGDAGVVRNAVDYAQDRGVAIFASVGNEQAAVKAWPAAYPGVISVSGVDAQLSLAYFSNSGGPTVAAPAVSVPSAYFEDGRDFTVLGDGTSQASALAAGLGATFRSWGFDVPSAITGRARGTGAPRHEVGAGVISVGPMR